MIYANAVSGELASGQFYDQLAASYYLSPDKLESDFNPVRFERELRLFHSHCPRGAVLDVGCSTGAFLCALKARWPAAYVTTGTDAAGPALDHAEGRGLEVLRGPFLELDLGAPRFDAITFWAVVEHLAEPKRFLGKAAEMLKPGGHCFVLVPNVRSLAMRVLGPRYRYVMPEHLNYFSADTLRRFVEAVPGLELVSLTSTHFNPVVVWQDFWKPHDRVADADRARLLKRTTAWKQHPALAPLKLTYGFVERGLGVLRLADNLVAALRRR